MAINGLPCYSRIVWKSPRMAEEIWDLVFIAESTFQSVEDSVGIHQRRHLLTLFCRGLLRCRSCVYPSAVSTGSPTRCHSNPSKPIITPLSLDVSILSSIGRSCCERVDCVTRDMSNPPMEIRITRKIRQLQTFQILFLYENSITSEHCIIENDNGSITSKLLHSERREWQKELLEAGLCSTGRVNSRRLAFWTHFRDDETVDSKWEASKTCRLILSNWS